MPDFTTRLREYLRVEDDLEDAYLTLAEVVTKIGELHSPELAIIGETRRCPRCLTAWPCATVRAIIDGLHLEGDDA